MPLAVFPDLRDRSVFITGGGSGIGAALTEGFVEQGARVAFVQRSDATAFCDAVESRHGRRPLFIRCDITDVPRLRAAIAEAEAAHGTIRVLVNNAANDDRHDTLAVTEDYWEKCIAINLKAYFFAAQAVIPGMRAAGGGVIVNFSSISYMMGHGGYPIYAASNAGITGLTRSLARDYGRDGIRANALMPGWVLTERQIELWGDPDALEAHLARQCIPEHLKPADIVGGTLFLASEASRMMTGQALVIDGGVVVTG
jgi:NAD(P)-dependent dehydrogenase (short-subunit alcohol dehydrogenase family)